MILFLSRYKISLFMLNWISYIIELQTCLTRLQCANIHYKRLKEHVYISIPSGLFTVNINFMLPLWRSQFWYISAIKSLSLSLFLSRFLPLCPTIITLWHRFCLAFPNLLPLSIAIFSRIFSTPCSASPENKGKQTQTLLKIKECF